MEEPVRIIQKVKEELRKVIIGQDEVIDGILAAMIVGGHVLLEGPPGVGKTLIAKSIARILTADFKRVQFTPDLMPLDITGTNVFDFQRQQFTFHPGPVFTDLLLADEINRTPPKTQAALLEAMEEKQVTIDGQIRHLDPIFTVVATQNPLEYDGTYPLPEAQLDRFLFKLVLSYPEAQEEIDIYRKYQHGMVSQEAINQIEPVLNKADLLELRNLLSQIKVQENIHEYIYVLVKATRENPFLMLGASPRSGIFILLAAKANAMLQGRDYVIPEDIQEVVYPVLRHRLVIKPEALIDGKNCDLIVKNLLASIKIPR